MIEVAIVSIGSELLEGSVIDSNSAFISNKLTRMGFKVSFIRQMPDDRDVLILLLKSLLSNYKLILTTGGLGPTFDDLTPEIISVVTEREYTHNDIAFGFIESRLNKLNVKINEGHKRQAYLPKGAKLFQNNYGTAVGFGVDYKDSFIVSLPGVPFEMKGIFNEYLAPYLKERFNPDEIFIKDIVFMNIAESVIDDAMIEYGIPTDIQAIINAGSGMVKVKLRGYNKGSIDSFINYLTSKFADSFLGCDDITPSKYLIELCRKYKLTVSTAESCTGGLIAKTITDNAGSSAIFTGAVVSYSNDVKVNQLNVDRKIVEDFGAVSSECAKAMAKGVRELLGTDYAISTTGIAGPDGATAIKKVGLIYIATSSKFGEDVYELNLNGDRESIRVRTGNLAVFRLIEKIKRELI